MWQRHCVLLVLLGAAFANAIPVWFYNTGFQNPAPIGVACSYFTKEYDSNTGYFVYRCNLNKHNTRHVSHTTLVETITDNEPIIDMDSGEEDLGTAEVSHSVAGRYGGLVHTNPTMYGSLTSGRSGSRNTKNKRPKKPTTSRRNRCPVGQIFQSELNICIDYPSAPPLPPKRPSDSRLSSYDSMMSDAPVRTSTFRQNPAAALIKPTPVSGTILTVGKIDLKNRCQPTEIYVSELDICLPINNCYPYGSTC